MNETKENNKKLLLIMGIGHQALMTYEEIIPKGYLGKCESIIELGAQIIPSNYQQRAKNLVKDDNKNELNTRDFYLKMGFKNYDCIDADGTNNALVFDLNHNIQKKYNFQKKYDLVTNLGTSEHVFNQKNCFLNIHNLAKKDGLIFNILPFEGQFNHCYFNYHPVFFYDLALFNNYEILGFWYYSCRSAKKFAPYDGYNFDKPFKYNNDLLKYFDRISKQNKISCTPLDNDSHLGVLYKKKSDSDFMDPFQSIYLEDDENLKRYKTKLENYDKYSKDLNKKNLLLNSNVDHSKQIEELLGNRIWNFKLSKLMWINLFGANKLTVVGIS